MFIEVVRCNLPKLINLDSDKLCSHYLLMRFGDNHMIY